MQTREVFKVAIIAIQTWEIKLIFLSLYSPELNPIEHFWHWLKKMTTDMLRFFTDLDSVICSSSNVVNILQMFKE